MVSTGHVNAGWAVAYCLSALAIAVIILLGPRPKALATGQDGRLSTSKVQVLLWTYAVLFALWALFFGWLIPTVGDGLNWKWATQLADPLSKGFTDNFLSKGLDATYLVLLGFPLAAAVSAKAITTSKVASGDEAKTTAAPGTQNVGQLVEDDDGRKDLGDYQYFLFTLLAVAYFLALFLAHPSKGLPDMPDTLVGLTGVAAAAYVAKKGLYRDPPVLYSIDPPQAALGDSVSVYGSRLAVAPGGAGSPPAATKPSVLFGSTPGQVTEIADDGSQLTVTVPLRLQAGATTVRVVRPPGAESDTVSFEALVTAPLVTAVHNTQIILGTDTTVTVEGQGFLAGGEVSTARNAVTIGGRKLPGEATWADRRVVVTLPTDAAAIKALGLENGSDELVVYDAEGRPSQAQAVTVSGVPA